MDGLNHARPSMLHASLPISDISSTDTRDSQPQMKPLSPPGILLYGYYGSGNLGDDLLLSVLLERLRPLVPGARFLVRDHGNDAGGVPIAPDVILTGAEAALADQRRWKIRRLVSYAWTYFELLKQCQWLIFGGGTLFHERGSRNSLLLQWMICCLARLLGVRIAALGVGVAELESRGGRALLRRIVAMSDLFLVRDEAALRQCAGTSARLTEDLVFCWAWRFNAQPRKLDSKDHRTIGLTIHRQALQGTRGTAIQTGLAEAVRSWRTRGHHVIFLVFQRTGAMPGDETIFSQIMDRVGGQTIETRILPTDPDDIATAFDDLDVVSGMRYHGLVLAAMRGLPFIGIAYDNKVSEICRVFDMPCLDLDHFDGKQLVAAFDGLSGRVPRPYLIQAAAHAAEKNFAAFARLIP
jgi:polysaccharide pyruvyl transferase WcaK-like protein